MTTKILIQTLMEIPDLQLLNQLFDVIKKTDSLVIPDVRKLFDMISNLYMCKGEKIICRTFQMNQHINKIMLNTEVQISWQHMGKSLVCLCGQQNSQIRKRARNIILQIMSKSGNSYMILQKLFYEGLQDESIIVCIYSIKLIFRVLQQTPNMLAKKNCINIVKLILQKMIRLSNSNHTDLQKNANHFLHRLFFLKIDKMDEVLQRVDPFYVKSLETIWQKNKQNLLYKTEQLQSQEVKALKQIKYEHLPMINDKIFGVYEPFVIKNLFNPETRAAKKFSIQQFKELFYQNEDRLTKYINSMCKIILKLIPERSSDILQLLAKIISLPGITNIINVNQLSSVLISQLDCEDVGYRKQLRGILNKFNYLSTSSEVIIKKYQDALQNDGQEILNWLKIYQILCLIEHWSQEANALQCYPPTLNFVVKYISLNLNHRVIKVKDQCQKLLFYILQKFGGYRQNLEEYFDQKMVGHFEDLLQSRKAVHITKDSRVNQSKQTFIKQFDQQRLKFIKYKKR